MSRTMRIEKIPNFCNIFLLINKTSARRLRNPLHKIQHANNEKTSFLSHKHDETDI